MKTEVEDKQQQHKKEKKILENQSKESLLVELLECLRVNRMQRFLQKVFFFIL
jgi:hypothetical protein